MAFENLVATALFDQISRFIVVRLPGHFRTFDRFRNFPYRPGICACRTLAGGFAGKDKCITKPDDVKGLQTRAAGKAFEQVLAAAGASIASMALSEVYNAMQTGVLQAANTSSSSFESYRIYEQLKCYTPADDTALWSMYQPLLMNKSAYDDLDDKQKAALDEAAAKAQAFYLDEAKKQDAQSVEAFKKAGVEIKEMTADEFKAWWISPRRVSTRP